MMSSCGNLNTCYAEFLLRIGNKSLSEPMMTYIADASLNFDKLMSWYETCIFFLI